MNLEHLLMMLVAAIAAGRVSVLIAHDKIMEPIMKRLWLKWPPQDNLHTGHDYQHRDEDGGYLPPGVEPRDWHWFSELTTCTRCLTVWLTPPMYLLMFTSAWVVVSVVAAMLIAAKAAQEIQ